jgi:hypothetical protein
MEEEPSGPEPRCPKCGAELFTRDLTPLKRALAVAALLVGVGLLVAQPPATGPDLRPLGITAAVLLALILWRRGLRYQCPDCGESFRRCLPPRGQTPEREPEQEE